MENNMIVQLNVEQLSGLIKKAVEEVLNERETEKKKIRKQLKKETKLMSREEVEKFLGVSDTTLHNWNKSGELPAQKIGRRVYYNKSDIMAKLSSCQASKKAKVK